MKAAVIAALLLAACAPEDAGAKLRRECEQVVAAALEADGIASSVRHILARERVAKCIAQRARQFESGR